MHRPERRRLRIESVLTAFGSLAERQCALIES
jgi:hypothetical protein